MNAAKSRPGSLVDLQIFAVKGDAEPTAINDGPPVTVAPEIATSPSKPAPPTENKQGRARRPVAQPVPVDPRIPPSSYYKSLTVKVDERRYKALAMLSVTSGKSHQEIMVQGLDLLLASEGRSQG